MKSFEYFYTKTAVGNLELEDIGNCIIEAANDEGLLFYLMISTSLGWTKIVEYGPAAPDFYELPKSCFCSFSRIEYDERKIHKRIDEFLNTPKRNITQAQEVDADVFFDSCKSILDYVKNPENF